MTPGINRKTDYIELLKRFPPRPVRTEADLLRTQEVIDSLLDRSALSSDERDYLNVLGTLVYEYDKEHIHIPDIYGVELLKVLISERGLRQKDLVAIFKTESIVSEVLNGQRKLTVEHIQKLAEFFNISPALFFERPRKRDR